MKHNPKLVKIPKSCSIILKKLSWLDLFSQEFSRCQYEVNCNSKFEISEQLCRFEIDKLKRIRTFMEKNATSIDFYDKAQKKNFSKAAEDKSTGKNIQLPSNLVKTSSSTTTEVTVRVFDKNKKVGIKRKVSVPTSCVSLLKTSLSKSRKSDFSMNQKNQQAGINLNGSKNMAIISEKSDFLKSNAAIADHCSITLEQIDASITEQSNFSENNSSTFDKSGCSITFEKTDKAIDDKKSCKNNIASRKKCENQVKLDENCKTVPNFLDEDFEGFNLSGKAKISRNDNFISMFKKSMLESRNLLSNSFSNMKYKEIAKINENLKQSLEVPASKVSKLAFSTCKNTNEKANIAASSEHFNISADQNNSKEIAKYLVPLKDTNLPIGQKENSQRYLLVTPQNKENSESKSNTNKESSKNNLVNISAFENASKTISLENAVNSTSDSETENDVSLQKSNENHFEEKRTDTAKSSVSNNNDVENENLDLNSSPQESRIENDVEKNNLYIANTSLLASSKDHAEKVNTDAIYSENSLSSELDNVNVTEEDSETKKLLNSDETPSIKETEKCSYSENLHLKQEEPDIIEVPVVKTAAPLITLDEEENTSITKFNDLISRNFNNINSNFKVSDSLPAVRDIVENVVSCSLSSTNPQTTNNSSASSPMTMSINSPRRASLDDASTIGSTSFASDDEMDPLSFLSCQMNVEGSADNVESPVKNKSRNTQLNSVLKVKVKRLKAKDINYSFGALNSIGFDSRQKVITYLTFHESRKKVLRLQESVSSLKHQYASNIDPTPIRRNIFSISNMVANSNVRPVSSLREPIRPIRLQENVEEPEPMLPLDPFAHSVFAPIIQKEAPTVPKPQGIILTNNSQFGQKPTKIVYPQSSTQTRPAVGIRPVTSTQPTPAVGSLPRVVNVGGTYIILSPANEPIRYILPPDISEQSKNIISSNSAPFPFNSSAASNHPLLFAVPSNKPITNLQRSSSPTPTPFQNSSNVAPILSNYLNRNMPVFIPPPSANSAGISLPDSDINTTEPEVINSSGAEVVSVSSDDEESRSSTSENSEDLSEVANIDWFDFTSHLDQEIIRQMPQKFSKWLVSLLEYRQNCSAPETFLPRDIITTLPFYVKVMQMFLAFGAKFQSAGDLFNIIYQMLSSEVCCLMHARMLLKSSNWMGSIQYSRNIKVDINTYNNFNELCIPILPLNAQKYTEFPDSVTYCIKRFSFVVHKETKRVLYPLTSECVFKENNLLGKITVVFVVSPQYGVGPGIIVFPHACLNKDLRNSLRNCGAISDRWVLCAHQSGGLTQTMLLEFMNTECLRYIKERRNDKLSFMVKDWWWCLSDSDLDLYYAKLNKFTMQSLSMPKHRDPLDICIGLTLERIWSLSVKDFASTNGDLYEHKFPKFLLHVLSKLCHVSRLKYWLAAAGVSPINQMAATEFTQTFRSFTKSPISNESKILNLNQ